MGNLPTSSRDGWHPPWGNKAEEKTLEGGLIGRQQAPLGQSPPKKEVLLGTFEHYGGVISLFGKLIVRGLSYIGCIRPQLDLGVMPVLRYPPDFIARLDISGAGKVTV